MTKYGVQPSGFVKKTLAIILQETSDSITGKLKRNINLSSASPLGQMNGTYCEREARIWDILEEVYVSQYPDTAADVSLTRAVELTGTRRLPPAKSRVPWGIGYGQLGASFDVGSIIVSVKGNPQARFVNMSRLAIDKPAADEVYEITFLSQPETGFFRLGFDQERSSQIAAKASAQNVKEALSLLFSDVQVTIDAGKLNLSFPVGALRPPDLSVFDNSLKTAAGAPVDIEMRLLQRGHLPFGYVSMESETEGSWSAPEGSLTEIATPQPSLMAFSNEDRDATVGRAFEEDPDLKIRRLQELDILGASTVDAIASRIRPHVDQVFVIANTDDKPDSEGRPPHTVEVIVQGGGEAAGLAKLIWQNVAGGIETWAPAPAVPVVIVDSQGFPHNVWFSRPAVIDVHILVAITEIGPDFPDSASSAIQDRILAAGKRFKMGDDIVIFPYLMGALATIPGIKDLTIELGKSWDNLAPKTLSIRYREVGAFSRELIRITLPPSRVA